MVAILNYSATPIASGDHVCSDRREKPVVFRLYTAEEYHVLKNRRGKSVVYTSVSTIIRKPHSPSRKPRFAVRQTI